MQIKTKASGIVEVPEEHIITIPAGLCGFEDYTTFALYDSTYHPFVWLQSLQNENLAFLMIDPFLVCDDYETDIDDKELKKIDIEDPGDVRVMTLVTAPGDGNPVTANLMGPLIINKRNRKAMQVIVDDSRWSTKYKLLEGLEKRQRGKKC